MGYLDSLAGGLRAAAGIMSPEIQKQTAEEDQRNNLLRAQQAQMLVQSLQQQVANGSISPEQAAQGAQSLGVNVPAQVIGGPSIEAQAKRQALDNEMGFRQAVAASGGDLSKIAGHAAQFGKMELAVSIYNQQENRLARIQDARDKAEQRMQELQMRLEDKAITREQQAQYQQGLLALRAQSNALQAELARGNQQLKELQIRMAGDQRDRAKEDRLDRGVTSFANELQQQKIPGLSASITSANTLLKKYEGMDIPGLGVVAGSKVIPNWSRSEESKNVRSSLQAVSNDLLNLYSGLAVTLPEAERRELESMQNGTFTSQDFKNAWPRIVNRYNTVVGNLAAGAGPDVLQRYQSRPGAMSLKPIEPAFTAQNTDILKRADAIIGGGNGGR